MSYIHSYRKKSSLFDAIYEHLDKEIWNKLIAPSTSKRLSPYAAKITFTHLLYLKRIYELRAPFVSELAETLGYTHASVSTMISKLINFGLVKKSALDKDKRMVRVELTEAGIEIFKFDRTIFMRSFEDLLSPLSSQEKETIESLLWKCLEAVITEA